MSKRKVKGTKEWSDESRNCITGCRHNCRYCYARFNAIKKWKYVKDNEEWANPKVRWKDVNKKQKPIKGTLMFPTTHDITPEELEPCLIFLKNILGTGDKVLIVSKPHLDCIKKICEECEEYKGQILFRFTIGAMDNDVLKYWEPDAPEFGERLASLEYAFNAGYATSVSVEPMLDSENVVALFHTLEPLVTDSIWIGKMNELHKRVEIESDEDTRRVLLIEEGQTDDRIREIYAQLKDEPKVKWKESFKEVLGLELADKPGLDK